MRKYYAIEPPVVFGRRASWKTRSEVISMTIARRPGVPLKLKFVDLPTALRWSISNPTRFPVTHTLCIAGTLDINFGRRLTQQLASVYADYPTIIMGMLTWDNIREFARPEFKGTEIVFPTHSIIPRPTGWKYQSEQLFQPGHVCQAQRYVVPGYEVTWKFARLLLQYGRDLSSNIANKQFRSFTDFDIQPGTQPPDPGPGLFLKQTTLLYQVAGRHDPGCKLISLAVLPYIQLILLLHHAASRYRHPFVTG